MLISSPTLQARMPDGRNKRYLLLKEEVYMNTRKNYWEYRIIDALPPVGELDSYAVGDIYGDGREVIVVGGNGAMFWYRPDTLERGTIDTGHFVCGIALEDIDGD